MILMKTASPEYMYVRMIDKNIAVLKNTERFTPEKMLLIVITIKVTHSSI